MTVTQCHTVSHSVTQYHTVSHSVTQFTQYHSVTQCHTIEGVCTNSVYTVSIPEVGLWLETQLQCLLFAHYQSSRGSIGLQEREESNLYMTQE